MVRQRMQRLLRLVNTLLCFAVLMLPLPRWNVAACEITTASTAAAQDVDIDLDLDDIDVDLGLARPSRMQPSFVHVTRLRAARSCAPHPRAPRHGPIVGHALPDNGCGAPLRC